MSSPIYIDRANEDDLIFLGKAVLLAERAHTGTGIWDVLFKEVCKNDEEIISVLKNAAKSDSCHFYFERFFVARLDSNPVASACGFYYPNCSLSKSKFAICDELLRQRKVLEESKFVCWENLNFLDDAFPDCDYENSWMVEAVFVEPSCRGKRLAKQLIEHVLAEGSKLGHHKALITCAVGNEYALRVYVELGFEMLATGCSDECQSKLGSSGFHVLQKSIFDSHIICTLLFFKNKIRLFYFFRNLMSKRVVSQTFQKFAQNVISINIASNGNNFVIHCS